MKIVTFRAESMPRALARVKKEMGSDAIILHTRTIRVGGFMGLGKRTMVEIVAQKDDGHQGRQTKNQRGRQGHSHSQTQHQSGYGQVPAARARRLRKLYSVSGGVGSNIADSAGSVATPAGSRSGIGAGGSNGSAVNIGRIDMTVGTGSKVSAGHSSGLRDSGDDSLLAENAATSALGRAAALELGKASGLRKNMGAGNTLAMGRNIGADSASVRGGRLTQTAGAEQIDNRLRKDISEIRNLVENLVREQRQLHTPDMPEQLFDLYLNLIQREVADEMAREMMQKLRKTMTGDQLLHADLVRRKLVEVMDSMICTAGPICRNLDGSARVVTLIGPTGVGKTTTIAKIAANLKLRQNKKVGLITIDTYRIGAVDQLRMYARIIDVPLKVVLTPADLKEAVDSMRSDMDVVLIDTAGRSQTDELKLQELKAFLDAAGPDETHLVLSSTAHHSHMLSAAEKFKTLGVDRLIITKLDEAISFGVLLSVMRKMETSISYITTGQDVPEDIEVGNSRRLARLLLGIEKVSANSMA